MTRVTRSSRVYLVEGGGDNASAANGCDSGDGDEVREFFCGVCSVSPPSDSVLRLLAGCSEEWVWRKLL
jgi:hypothetical protein